MQWLFARIFSLFAIATIALILGVAVFLYRIDAKVTIDAAKRNALDNVTRAADLLGTKLAVRETIATSVAVTTSLLPETNEDTFADLATRISLGRQDILNLAYAPDLVVRYVYPKDANASVIGLDYREPSQFTVGADRALETNAPVLIGPIDLLQGGRGLILRVPVRPIEAHGAKAQSLVSLVMDINKLVDQHDALNDFDHYTIAAYVGEAGVSEDNLIFGSVSQCGSDSLMRAFPVIDATWTYCIAPKAGWPVHGENSKEIIVLAGLAILTAIFVFVVVTWLRARESKAKSRLWDAIEAIHDGFALYDKDDRLVLCNSRYREIYSASASVIRPGVTFREVIEYGAWNGQYAEAVGNEAEWIEKRMALHRDPQGEREQHHANGRWLKISERKTSDGGTVGFRVDITDLKRAQHEAEAATRAITEFLNNINHEIRTPLTVIVGFATFLARPEALVSHKMMEKALEDTVSDPDKTREAVWAFASEVKKYADRIEKSSSHLHTLVQDTLDLSKVTRGDFNLHLEQVDLGLLITECTEQFEDEASKKGIDLQVDAPSVDSLADPSRLRQIMFNLIGNAVKFTDSGYVKVSIESDENAVVIKVADSGHGIAEEHRQRVFKKFWQIDGSDTRKHGGTGLGLAISDELVRLHGGKIWIESSAEGGSIFCVRLPRTQLHRMAG